MIKNVTSYLTFSLPSILQAPFLFLSSQIWSLCYPETLSA